MKSETSLIGSPPLEEISWRDGDVYFWRYRDELGDQTLKYWCRARKAIVRGDVLADIYWAYIDDRKISFHSDGGLWTRDQAKKHLTLDYKGNLDQFDAIPDYREEMYDNADILDLRHANSSQKQIYLRRGASRSKERMLEEVRHKRAKAESAIRMATFDVERFNKVEAEILSGVDLNTLWI